MIRLRTAFFNLANTSGERGWEGGGGGDSTSASSQKKQENEHSHTLIDGVPTCPQTRRKKPWGYYRGSCVYLGRCDIGLDLAALSGHDGGVSLCNFAGLVQSSVLGQEGKEVLSDGSHALCDGPDAVLLLWAGDGGILQEGGKTSALLGHAGNGTKFLQYITAIHSPPINHIVSREAERHGGAATWGPAAKIDR